MHYDFEHDDAYISYRYADNWAHGHGPVYNPGEIVEGYSNFLWVAMLRAAAAVGIEVRAAARGVGAVSHLILILIVFHFVVRRCRRSAGLAVGAAAVVAMHAAVAVWAPSGMETVPFALLSLLAMSRFAAELQGERDHWGSGLLFGICALLRADGFLFVIATAVYLVGRRSRLRRALTLLAGFAVVFAPYFAWRFDYYGYLFPNTYYAKVGDGVFQQLRGLFYFYNGVAPFGGLLLFALPLVLIVRRDAARDRMRAYLACVVLTLAAYIVWVGGDHMPMARFLVPLIAVWAILTLEAAVEVAACFEGAQPKHGSLVLSALAACAVASVTLPTLNQRRLPASYVIGHRTLVEQWTRAGVWLRDHAAQDAVLATEPAGAIAYVSGLTTIDMLGLNDIHIAHLEVPDLGRGSAGHEKRDFAYVLSRRPDFIFRGVRSTPCADADSILLYGPDRIYRRHCEPLGVGPSADAFGVVTQVPLFIWLDQRVASVGDSAATANGLSDPDR